MIYVQHLTICDLCQRTDFQKYQYVNKTDPGIPEIPEGWRYLNHQWNQRCLGKKLGV